MGRKQIEESGGEQGGENLALAGLIMGIAEIAVALLFFCFFAFSLAGLVALPEFQELMQELSP
jgi:putative exporter of polyketide antibiotics